MANLALETIKGLPGATQQVARTILGEPAKTQEEALRRGSILVGKTEVGLPFLTIEQKAVQVADTALSRLVNAIKSAKPLGKQIERLQSAEISRRVGAATGILGKVKGTKGFIQAKAQLKGRLLPERPKFEPLRIGEAEKGIIPQELEPLAQEARKFKSAEEFVRVIAEKQKTLVDDLIRQSNEAFAKSGEITGTAKIVKQNGRYIKLGIELKNRAIREERKLLNTLSADKLTDFYNQAV